MVIKYDDGTNDVIDISEHLNKNSNGGFFVKSQKEPIVKVGEKIKADQVIAKDPTFFIGSNSDDITYTVGKLTKVAIASGDFTFEDSSIVTQSMSEAMSTKVTMKKEITLGTNATIEKIVKKGDYIKTGEPLIVFENSFEDDTVNDILGTLGDELGEEIGELSKNTMLSKYTGEIVDVKIYYNKEIEEFSPSIQKILKDYIKKGLAKKKIVNEINPVNNVILPATEKQKTDKIKGQDVDGILIEIYIEYIDNLSIGDNYIIRLSLRVNI